MRTPPLQRTPQHEKPDLFRGPDVLGQRSHQGRQSKPLLGDSAPANGSNPGIEIQGQLAFAVLEIMQKRGPRGERGPIALGGLGQISHEIPGQLLSIGLIAAGGVVFAWLYYRWRFNLWVAIGLHGFMNLWYALFAVGDTPIGSTWLIAARIAVAAIAITATEIYVRRKRGMS